MRLKVLVVSLLAALLATVFIFAGAGAEDKESKMHIKFSTWHPPMSREVRTVWKPMLEELKKRSNGRITYTLYAGGALGKGPEHYDIVKNGLSDMGYFTATWTPVPQKKTSSASKTSVRSIGRSMVSTFISSRNSWMWVLRLIPSRMLSETGGV